MRKPLSKAAVQDYRRGVPYAVLTKRYGVSNEYIADELRRLGVPLRGKGRDKHHRPGRKPKGSVRVWMHLHPATVKKIDTLKNGTGKGAVVDEWARAVTVKGLEYLDLAVFPLTT